MPTGVYIRKPQISIEEAQERLNKKHNGNIVIIEYCGSISGDSKLKCLRCGNIWMDEVNGVSLGTGCRVCREKGIGTTSVMSLEEAKARILETHGGKIEILEYTGGNKPGKFHCNVCGYEWVSKKAGQTINRNGCLNCQHLNDKLSFEYVRDYIASKGGKLLSEKYVNSREDLHILMPCGHEDYMNWNDFQSGREQCTNCGIKIRSDKHRTKEENIIKYIESLGFIFIDFPNGFKKQKESTVRYMCEEGHITERKVDKIYQYPTCKECEFEDLAELHRGENNHFWKGGTTALRAFATNQIQDWKLKWMKVYDFKCAVLPDKKFENVHHLKSFASIIFEALDNLKLPIFETMDKYTKEEVENLSYEIKRLHEIYPGIPLCREVHVMFHKLYKRGNNTPEQWYEFMDRIKSGEIVFNN